MKLSGRVEESSGRNDGGLMSSPKDLIKTQIQMEVRQRLLGQPPQLHGTGLVMRPLKCYRQELWDLARMFAQLVSDLLVFIDHFVDLAVPGF